MVLRIDLVVGTVLVDGNGIKGTAVLKVWLQFIVTTALVLQILAVGVGYLTFALL